MKTKNKNKTKNIKKKGKRFNTLRHNKYSIRPLKIKRGGSGITQCYPQLHWE